MALRANAEALTTSDDQTLLRAGQPSLSGSTRGGSAARFQRAAPTISPSGRHLRAQRGWTQWLSVTWRVLAGQQTCVTVGRCVAGVQRPGWLVHTC